MKTPDEVTRILSLRNNLRGDEMVGVIAMIVVRAIIVATWAAIAYVAALVRDSKKRTEPSPPPPLPRLVVHPQVITPLRAKPRKEHVGSSRCS